MVKVKLEHELLDSKIATASALFNEFLKWCEENDIKPYQITHITQSFQLTQQDYDNDVQS